jgi:hypothetical protein
MKCTMAVLALAILLPNAAAAQDGVNRRTYTFLENHLDVAVIAEVPGVLQVVRGERGRVEVAGRSLDGFPGSALGGRITRQLRLTAVGAQAVEYLVVVPEHVVVRIQLPDGTAASLAPGAAAASYRWLAAGAAGPVGARYLSGAANGIHGTALPGTPPDAGHLPHEPQLMRTAGGLFVAHQSAWAPAVIDVPDLASIRSLDVRFEGGDFRVAASRPLSVERGDASHFVLRADGEPVDIVLFIPRGSGRFILRADGVRIAESVAGQPRALCSNVVIQHPTVHQTWLTFRPQAGRIDCRR